MSKILKTADRKSLVVAMDEYYQGNEVGKHVWGMDSGKSGPTVTILEGSHGDETERFAIIRTIMNLIKANGLKFGNVVTGIGNTAGFITDKRFKHLDLNRCYGEDDGGEEYEKKRARILKPFLAKSDVMFDMHATIKPSDPFLVVPNLNHPAASCLDHFDVSKIISGPGLYPPSGEPIYSDTYVAAHGGLGVTVEAGWLEKLNPKLVTQWLIKALNELEIWEVEPIDDKNEEEGEQIKYNAYWNVVAGNNFHFVKEFGNFDVLVAGTTFAYEGDVPLKVPKDSVIIFPKSANLIKAGSEVCMIAEVL